MSTPRTPIGQRTEVTNPVIAIVGALAILVLATLAFSFWPNTETVHTATNCQSP